jgi:N-acetylated-alpha-linked acidic dipeptidase
VGYGGEDDGGIYHSIYDDFYWFTHFSDTSFVYGRALAQTMGIAVMRLADADLLPFAFTNLAQTAREYAKELEQLRDRRADEIAERNRALEEGVYAATNDPRAPTTAPARLAAAPHLELAPLLDALDSLQHAADRYEQSYTKWSGGGSTTPDLAAINRELLQSERMLTSPNGLLKRPWFRHLLYAPGYYTGYGVKTMPGARESIEQGEWTQVGPEINRIAAVIRQEATHVSRLADRLGAR